MPALSRHSRQLATQQARSLRLRWYPSFRVIGTLCGPARHAENIFQRASVCDEAFYITTQMEAKSTFAWLRPLRVQGKQTVCIFAAVTVAVAGLIALSQYVFHSGVRPIEIVLLVAWLGLFAFLLGRQNAERVPGQNALPASGKHLEHSQKMEAIGRLAGGVAHDFNNLLAVITGYSDLLLESIGPSDPNRAKLEHIKQAASSAASLTRQLLMFSRQQVVQPIILDVNQIVTNTEKMLRRLIKENIEFAVVLDRDLSRVKADPGQIEQIVLNLVVNARDAMPNGGKLRIQTKNVRLDQGSVSLGPGMQRGQFVLLEVADTGTGMDQQTQAHIFEPFFTTKATGQGTGLGLATVYGIVKQSNGHIEVQSTLGQGSSFKIYFPVVEQEEANRESGKNAAKPAFSGESILVVEDARPLRDLICEALRTSGCTVLAAQDAQEALSIITQREGPVDLLLTDVVMPGMNGPALAKQVRLLRPQTKILYMTGYSGEFIRADMLIPGVSFIQKPFTPADLARKVSKMLTGQPSGDSASSHETAPKAAAAGTSA
jgi:two-component system, cell cycle sensor histidine kinase and response regulator CckA